MILEVGDKVRFLNEKGEGIITRINNEFAYVLIEEGFEIPVKVNQLVVIEKRKHDNLQKTIIKDSELKNYNYIEREESLYTDENFNPIHGLIIPEEELTNDIYLAFVVSVIKNENYFSAYIINDTKNYFTFCIFFKNNDGYKFIENGNLEPNTKILIAELKKEDLINIYKILIQAIIFSPTANEKGKIFEKEVKLQTIYLLNNQYYKETDFFEEPAFLLPLMNTDKSLEQIKSDKIFNDLNFKEPAKEEEKKEKDTELLEVDLHINELIEDTSNLNATEMLNIQLGHFRKKLEEAIVDKKIKRIVFIHGVGNGTLKLELRRILNKEYAHYDYQDASFAEYGYGATMVILRK